MTVSSISGISIEGQPQGLSAFLKAGIMHVVWFSVSGLALGRPRWKPHTGLYFTEVIGGLDAAFHNISACYVPSSDTVLLAWDDGSGEPGFVDGNIYFARFNSTTGALISGPTLAGDGSRPQLLYRNNVPGNSLLLFSYMKKTDDVTLRLSTNGGVSFGEAAPVLTNKVVNSGFVEAVPYDNDHVSIIQLGKDPRALAEFGLFKRTRPIVSILKHPTLADTYFIGEPSRITSVAQVDNLRGGMAFNLANTSIFKIDGDAQGTADGTGGIALLSVTSGTSMTVSASTGPSPGTNRNKIVQYSLVPVTGANADLDLSLPAVSLAVSTSYAYLAQYTEASPTGGQLKVVELANLSNQAAFLTGISGRATAVANFLSPVLIFTASTESSIERLRVYQENTTSPIILVNYKIPFRANALFVTAHPTNVAWALIYASTANRLTIYEYRGTTVPLRLLDSITLIGGGQLFNLTKAANGNLVAAAGNAGVLVLTPSGKTLAQIRVSGEVVDEWASGKAYVLGNLVRTRARHQFSANRYYFRVTTAGTSGGSEPQWAATGTMSDNTVVWTPVAMIDGVCTGVAVDDTLKRIYAVGVAGGNAGTDGRVWVLDARGLI